MTHDVVQVRLHGGAHDADAGSGDKTVALTTPSVHLKNRSWKRGVGNERRGTLRNTARPLFRS